jgi:hypothetical protein
MLLIKSSMGHRFCREPFLMGSVAVPVLQDQQDKYQEYFLEVKAANAYG